MLPYHHIDCKQLEGLRVTLTDKGREMKKFYSMLGISSKETIGAGFKAVDASPFKTVFVVRVATGEILFALSKNEGYVTTARKKKPKPDPGPPPPAESKCCGDCRRAGGTCGEQYPDGSCLCWGASGGTGGGLDDELETLAN
jgi:hypothetical protein